MDTTADTDFWRTESPEAGLREIMRKKPEYWIPDTRNFCFCIFDY